MVISTMVQASVMRCGTNPLFIEEEREDKRGQELTKSPPVKLYLIWRGWDLAPSPSPLPPQSAQSQAPLWSPGWVLVGEWRGGGGCVER